MRWEAWTVVVLYVASALATVALIGRDRKPITPGGAVIQLVTVGFMVWLILRLAGVA